MCVENQDTFEYAPTAAVIIAAEAQPINGTAMMVVTAAGIQAVAEATDHQENSYIGLSRCMDLARVSRQPT